jgi:preprotein translocase subunit SecD
MLKNIYFRLGLVSAVFTLALLALLPRTPITIKNQLIYIDSTIGGYAFRLPNGSVLDLRELKKGLDLEGGIRIVLKADMSKIEAAERDNALESAREIISRRVNLLGVSEPYITTQKVGDDYRLIVEIPGVDDVSSAVRLIGQTTQLKFKELAEGKEWTEDKAQEYYQDPTAWVDTNLTGADLKGVDVGFAQGTVDIEQMNRPQIQLRFSNEGRTKFEELAKRNINKPIALFLDESSFPISTPVVSPDLANGLTDDPVISGNFDVETAQSLSVNIRAGALPVPVEVMEQQTIGATLGSDSVSRSFFAGLVGLFLVSLFMIFQYKKLGLLAVIALFIYTIVTLAIYKIFGVVLTLPGIAGFILSIGMATDANVLVFERVKEEMIWGKPRSLALKLGFERAWSSIKDSNISSLITSWVLFEFGEGSVKGFALTLAIGIGVSLFSSIFVVRTLIEAFNFASPRQKSESKEKPGRSSRKIRLPFVRKTGVSA